MMELKSCRRKDRGSIINHKRLLQVLQYVPVDGLWFWLVKTKRTMIGDIAGSFDTKGYRMICVDGSSYKASRLAWYYMEGYWPENEIDHIDGNKSNDSWKNLRHVSSQCNQRNRSLRKNSYSGVTGVTLNTNKNRWSSRIMNNYKAINLGEFESLKDAVMARWLAEKKYGWENCNSTSTAYIYLKKRGLLNE